MPDIREPRVEWQRDMTERAWFVAVSRVEDGIEKYITIRVPDRGEWTTAGPLHATSAVSFTLPPWRDVDSA